MAKAPSVASLLLYTLSAADVAFINARRVAADSIRRRMDREPAAANDPATPAIPDIGNAVAAGDVLPLIVTKTNADGSINGRVVLDGSDGLWVKSIREGSLAGSYRWP